MHSTSEERNVPAIVDGRVTESRLRFEVGDVCRVEVRVQDVAVAGEGSDLFEALTAARRGLEARDIQLGCNGARVDVFPSGMLRQAAAGRRAYVLPIPRVTVKPPLVDIFDLAPEGSNLATVDEQREFFDRWLHSGPAIEETSQ